MSRRASTHPLALPARSPGAPAGEWLCTALRRQILEGRLTPGARLPASRELAAACGLARGTVVAAFDQLAAEGYLVGTRGSGTFVSAVRPDDLLQVPRDAVTLPRPPRRQPRRLSRLGRSVEAFPPFHRPPVRAFRANHPAVDLFPTAIWAQLTARRARRASASMLLGCSPLGHTPLRRAVADYLRQSRGVRCENDQVVIVGGVQEAIDLVTRLFVDPGDRVCLEDPGYVGAALAFAGAGARICRVPVDRDGMRIPDGRERGARLAYVTPAHQFPLGVSMTLARRLGLIDWAHRTGAVIVEDDYDSEYRYTGHPLPALQGLDRHGVVIFTGSFSKVCFPSLRLGFLVVPPDLVDRVAALKSIATRHAPVLEQAVLADFIAAGHFARHLRRMRQEYGGRLAVLLECARARLEGLVRVDPVEAGLQTVGWLAPGIAALRAEAAAAARGVEVAALSRYWARTPAPEALQLGFAPVEPAEIRRGVRELAIALESLE